MALDLDPKELRAETDFLTSAEDLIDNHGRTRDELIELIESNMPESASARPEDRTERRKKRSHK